jgi:hypothetical protein
MTSSKPVQEKERAEFEAFIMRRIAEGMKGWSLERDDFDYHSGVIFSMWQGWQARAAYASEARRETTPGANDVCAYGKRWAHTDEYVSEMGIFHEFVEPETPEAAYRRGRAEQAKEDAIAICKGCAEGWPLDKGWHSHSTSNSQVTMLCKVPYALREKIGK